MCKFTVADDIPATLCIMLSLPLLKKTAFKERKPLFQLCICLFSYENSYFKVKLLSFFGCK